MSTLLMVEVWCFVEKYDLYLDWFSRPYQGSELLPLSSRYLRKFPEPDIYNSLAMSSTVQQMILRGPKESLPGVSSTRPPF